MAEHVVDGKAILPGSGFIEIAISAAQQYYGTKEVDITNLEIVRPLELADNRMMELSTILSPETGDIEIRSRERLSEDDWAVHAVARSRKPIPADEITSGNAFAGLEKTATVTPAKAYETARQFGLDYGPRFQLMAKAVSYGDRFIDVELKEPEKTGNPFVSYSLNPISVDATFHGLVALFDRFTGEAGGAPYIPVRFGSVRLTNSGLTVKRALVEIERISANSIKAKFRFFGKGGEVIAAFDDCRFRRTYLRQHKTLEMLSFHYEAVPSDRAAPLATLGRSECTAFAIACRAGRKRHRQYDASIQRGDLPRLPRNCSQARQGHGQNRHPVASGRFCVPLLPRQLSLCSGRRRLVRTQGRQLEDRDRVLASSRRRYPQGTLWRTLRARRRSRADQQLLR
ncbi:polyketide synthase dehydratase domain-containing protein [Rhizobium sp. RCAM05350]|nr:polyketide synthase dehydratase domain-containing protein [Rhizobium sp. RCAM05350]